VLALLDGSTCRIEADALVIATTNQPETSLQDALSESALDLHTIGDCIAARQAPYAFYEGRKLGLSL
jgi:hypothetical protein